MSPPPARGAPHIRHAGSCVLQSRSELREGPAQSLVELSPRAASPATAALSALTAFPKSPSGGTARLADLSLASSLDRNLRPRTVGTIGSTRPARPCSAGARLPERRKSEGLAIKWLTWDNLSPQPPEAEVPTSEPPARSWSCGQEVRVCPNGWLSKLWSLFGCPKY